MRHVIQGLDFDPHLVPIKCAMLANCADRRWWLVIRPHYIWSRLSYRRRAPEAGFPLARTPIFGGGRCKELEVDVTERDIVGRIVTLFVQNHSLVRRSDDRVGEHYVHGPTERLHHQNWFFV